MGSRGAPGVGAGALLHPHSCSAPVVPGQGRGLLSPHTRAGRCGHRAGAHNSPQPSLARVSSVFVFVIPLFFNCDFSGGERCWIDRPWRWKGL